MEGSESGLIQCTALTFYWRDREKQENVSQVSRHPYRYLNPVPAEYEGPLINNVRLLFRGGEPDQEYQHTDGWSG